MADTIGDSYYYDSEKCLNNLVNFRDQTDYTVWFIGEMTNATLIWKILISIDWGNRRYSQHKLYDFHIQEQKKS